MKHLATYSNAGEAGFYQSLLAGAGIEAELRDGRSDLGGVSAAQLFVAEENHGQAALLVAAQATAEPSPKPGRRHPAEGFPFLGITGFTAIVWSVLYALRAVKAAPRIWEKFGTLTGFLELLAMGAMVFLYSLFVGAVVALICLVVKVTLQKFRA